MEIASVFPDNIHCNMDYVVQWYVVFAQVMITDMFK